MLEHRQVDDSMIPTALMMVEAEGFAMPADIKTTLSQRFSDWTKEGHTHDDRALVARMPVMLNSGMRAAPPNGAQVFLKEIVEDGSLNGKKGVVVPLSEAAEAPGSQSNRLGRCAVRLDDGGRVVVVKYGNVTANEPSSYRQFGNASSAPSTAHDLFCNLLSGKRSNA